LKEYRLKEQATNLEEVPSAYEAGQNYQASGILVETKS
jgi:hypothetical protein